MPQEHSYLIHSCITLRLPRHETEVRARLFLQARTNRSKILQAYNKHAMFLPPPFAHTSRLVSRLRSCYSNVSRGLGGGGGEGKGGMEMSELCFECRG